MSRFDDDVELDRSILDLGTEAAFWKTTSLMYDPRVGDGLGRRRGGGGGAAAGPARPAGRTGAGRHGPRRRGQDRPQQDGVQRCQSAGENDGMKKNGAGRRISGAGRGLGRFFPSA